MKPRRISELKPGLTQTLTPAQWRKVDAKRVAEAKAQEAKRPAVRRLSGQEMASLRGRGSYRNKFLQGTLPWHRTLRDVNVCTGNLFKSFTDIQVAPARGAGLALQRTYNSEDDRPGPFGIGWTHAYDIRMEEEPISAATPPPGSPSGAGKLDTVDRTDFFGGKHAYHRDADGLYSPPPYLFDETESAYGTFLVEGPRVVLSDTETGMDGTKKHFIANGSERVCDSITDRYGNATVLAYNQTVTIGGSAKNLLTSVTDPSGRQLTFTWGNQGTAQQPAWRITSVQGPQYTVTYAYNAEANLQSVTLDPTGLNRTTTFGYTSVGYTKRDGTPGTESGLLSSITDPLNHTVSYTYAAGYTDPNNGQFSPNFTGTVWVTSVTEPAGVLPGTSTQRTLTWYITPAGSSVEGNTYIETRRPGATGSTSSDDLILMHVHFDGQLRKDFYWNFPSYSYAFDKTKYDSANNVLSQNQPLFRTYADGAITSCASYGPHGNALSSGTQINTDNYGNPILDTVSATGYFNGSQYFQQASVTDAANHVGSMGVGTKTAGTTGDPDTNPGDRGSVLWVRDAGYGVSGSPSYQKQFVYTYNQYGQKTSETNLSGVKTVYTYGDQWGNLTQVVQDPTPVPNDGLPHLNRTTTMTYDVGGHVLTSTDPNGKTATFTHNVLGQPTSTSFAATANTAAETVTYTYGANGRTATVSDNRGTTQLTYEAGSDRVASVSDPITGTIGYTYGVTGERLTMSLPGGGSWTYKYGTLDPGVEPAYAAISMPKDDPNSLMPRLWAIVDDQGRRVEFNNPSLDATYGLTGGDEISGRLRSVRSNQTFDTANPPNLLSYQQTDYVYDQANYIYSHGWLTSVTTRFWTKNQYNQWTSKLLMQNAYSYDSIGQRLTNAITSVDLANQNSGNTVSRTETYGYDVLNRLTTVNYGDGQTQSYAFDSLGNRTSKSDSATGSETYTFDAANRLTGRNAGGTNSVYTNDANGNTLTGGGRTSTWDSQNRLVSCVKAGSPNVTSSFVYGCDGIRRQEMTNAGGTSTTTDFVTDASLFIREINHSTGTSLATYLVGLRGPEYKRNDGNGTVRWYVFDGLGSVLGEVDPNGVVSGSRKHDVYGLTRSGTGTITSKHGFVGSLGHASEDETGLIYMQARYYDPQTGRFVSQDPSYNGTNWYVYGNSNPVNCIDPNGKVIVFVVVALLAFVVSATTCYLSGQPAWKCAIVGLVSAAAAIAACFGVGAGLVVGAAAGAFSAWLCGGSTTDILLGALFGGAFGALGGMTEGINPSGLMEALDQITKRELAAYLLLSFDEGMVNGDMGILSLAGRLLSSPNLLLNLCIKSVASWE